MRRPELTNATKGNALAFLNVTLGLVTLTTGSPSPEVTGAILAVVNAGFILVMGLTYKDSKKRIPGA